jgi:hypothetical protein
MPDPKDIDDLMASIDLNWVTLSDQLLPLLTTEAEDGARQILLQAGFATTEDSELWKTVLARVKEAAADRAAELVGMRRLKDGRIVPNPNPEWAITETTRENLQGLIGQAIDEGWAAGKTSSMIQDSESFAPSRALMIARTEAAFARARGTHIGAEEAGMKLKSWIVSDEETCDECEANAAQGEIAIDAQFDSGDDCSPAHPNCRCACGYSQSQENDEEGEEE